MRLILALRLFSEWHAKAGIEKTTEQGVQRGSLINMHVERRYPALNNMIKYFSSVGCLPAYRQGELLRYENGKKIVEGIGDARLYWCEVESCMPMDYWNAAQEVELVVSKDDFDRFALSIRGRAGAAYVDACEEYARALPVKAGFFAGYQPPRISKHRAA